MTEGGDRPVKVRDTRCDRAFGLGCVTGRSRTSAAPGAGGAGGAGGGNGGGGGQFYPAHAIIAARGDTEQQLVRTPPHTLAYTHRQPRWRTVTAVGAPRLRVQIIRKMPLYWPTLEGIHEEGWGVEEEEGRM